MLRLPASCPRGSPRAFPHARPRRRSRRGTRWLRAEAWPRAPQKKALAPSLEEFTDKRNTNLLKKKKKLQETITLYCKTHRRDDKVRSEMNPLDTKQLRPPGRRAPPENLPALGSLPGLRLRLLSPACACPACACPACASDDDTEAICPPTGPGSSGPSSRPSRWFRGDTAAR